jgi:hypothetical protein
LASLESAGPCHPEVIWPNKNKNDAGHHFTYFNLLAPVSKAAIATILKYLSLEQETQGLRFLFAVRTEPQIYHLYLFALDD